MISYFSEDIPQPKLSKRKITNWIKQIVATNNLQVGDISFIFCSDEKILEINNQYLQHDYYTDIITFDYTESNKIGGDVFISIDTVKTNADKYSIQFETELYRVIIHGVLHLCGQKDKTPSERKMMTQKEDEALQLLKEL